MREARKQLHLENLISQKKKKKDEGDEDDNGDSDDDDDDHASMDVSDWKTTSSQGMVRPI